MGAWCYTTDTKKRWEYCDVPQCEEKPTYCKDPIKNENRVCALGKYVICSVPYGSSWGDCLWYEGTNFTSGNFEVKSMTPMGRGVVGCRIDEDCSIMVKKAWERDGQPRKALGVMKNVLPPLPPHWIGFFRT